MADDTTEFTMWEVALMVRLLKNIQEKHKFVWHDPPAAALVYKCVAVPDNGRIRIRADK